MRDYLQYTRVHTEPVFGFLSIRDQLDLEDVFFSIYSDFEPDPSDDVSAAVHGAMLYKRDDEIREMFTNGTISADQPYVERRAVYDRLMHEDDMDMDSESDDDWSSESDEDGDCESE